jgi:hypothetical protein
MEIEDMRKILALGKRLHEEHVKYITENKKDKKCSRASFLRCF